MSTEYTISIDMDVDTVNQLDENDYYLYAFKGASSSAVGAEPLVWFRTPTFSTETTLAWETQYQAYTSLSEIVPGGTVEAVFSTDIDLGQTLEVTSDKGTGQVVDEGTRGVISIHNLTTQPFTCGISEVVEGEVNALCAVPLFGKGLNLFAPVEEVLLMFATQTVDTGTVIMKSFSSCFLIDMTGADENTRTVHFDINEGWSCDSCTWAEEFPANSDLSPLLINHNQESVEAMLRRATSSSDYLS